MYYDWWVCFLAAEYVCFLCERFPVDDKGTMKSVVEYFNDTYGYTISNNALPCLQVRNQKRLNYLPMEVSCDVYALV